MIHRPVPVHPERLEANATKRMTASGRLEIQSQRRPGEKIYQEVNAILQQIALGRTAKSGNG